MTRAALIIFGDDMPEARVAGLGWAEYRMRSAVTAGAQHIVVLATYVGPELVRTIDRLRASHIPVVLVRSSNETRDLFHPDEVVLLLSGHAIADIDLLRTLMATPVPGLLCVDVEADPARFELVDSQHRWTGIAAFSGTQIRAMAALPGEWDMASALLREGVRASAQRLIVDDVAALPDAFDPEQVATASRRTIGMQRQPVEGWGDRFLVQPIAQAAARVMVPSLPTVAVFAPLAGLAISVMALVTAWTGYVPIAFALLLLAALASRLGAVASGATGIGSLVPAGAWRVQDVAAALTAVVITARGLDHGPLVLTVAIVALTMLGRRLPTRGAVPWWRADVSGLAVTLFVGSLAGDQGLSVALAVGAAHALFSLAERQETALAAS